MLRSGWHWGNNHGVSDARTGVSAPHKHRADRSIRATQAPRGQEYPRHTSYVAHKLAQVAEGVDDGEAGGFGDIMSPASREGFAEFAAENLTGGGAGDGFDEMDLARLLVVGETLGNEAAEFAFKHG
jgi:hypothetical protein